jgi:hypothetical protein
VLSHQFSKELLYTQTLQITQTFQTCPRVSNPYGDVKSPEGDKSDSVPGHGV